MGTWLTLSHLLRRIRPLVLALPWGVRGSVAFCVSLLLLAQAHSAAIRGRVLTSNDAPVSFAYVYVEGRNMATQCDENGLFTLKTPTGSFTLTAACVGYISATAEAHSGDTNVVIYLKSNNLLDAVTVTATRTTKTIANTPVVTRIISAEDIRQTDATNIRDVLESELPGIEFTYSMNQQVSVNLQGMGGMAVLFLVDGERLAGETLDNTDFSRLNMDNIERIEIIKGAATALYGSNAVGAVINIITKQSAEPWSVQLNARRGSRYGTYRYGGTAGFNKGRVSNLFNVQNDGMDSYLVFDTTGESTQVYGNQQWNFKDKMVVRLNDRSSVTGRGGYYFHERNSSPTMKDRARAFSGGLRYENKISDDGRLDVSYSFDRYDKSDFYPQPDKEYLDYKNVQNSVRVLYNHTFDADLNLTTGGDVMNDYLQSYQFSSDENSHQQQTADLFAQADWNPGLHWNFVGGVRVDYFSRYGAEFTPKLAAMYKFGDCRIRGSYSKGFRAPTLKEMYMDFNMANIFNIYGNENLESEVSHSLLASFEYVREHVSATVTGYYNIINNEISTIWDPTLDNNGAMIYRNVDGTNLGSLDVTLVSRLDNGLNAKLSYTYFHEFPRNKGYNLSDTRPHSLVAQLNYAKTFKNCDVSVCLGGRVLSRASYYVVNSSENGAYDTYKLYTSAGYTLWKLMLIQRFKNAVTLTVTVDNLFNYKPKMYAYNSPYTLGRTFLVGVSLDVHRAVSWFNKND